MLPATKGERDQGFPQVWMHVQLRDGSGRAEGVVWRGGWRHVRLYLSIYLSIYMYIHIHIGNDAYCNGNGNVIIGSDVIPNETVYLMKLLN